MDAARISARERGAFMRDKSIPLMAPIGVPQSLINGDRDRIIPTHFAAVSNQDDPALVNGWSGDERSHIVSHPHVIRLRYVATSR